ncbi:hypothetical protein MMC27_002051 [Xylographa pallens]|nr:hypothetical protein [Xylographa pallens]
MSPAYLSDFSTSGQGGSANRSAESNNAPVSHFETEMLNAGLSFDQHLSFSENWPPDTNSLGQCPNASSDFMNGIRAFDDFEADSLSRMSETAWATLAEHPTEIPGADSLSGQMIVDSKEVEKDSQGRIRLTLENPAVETTKAVVEAVLNARGKMSMEADTASTVTLTLEDVTTATVKTVLHILFESKTKIKMEAN